MILAFNSEQEIEALRYSKESQRYKVNVRNALGVRHHFFANSGAASNPAAGMPSASGGGSKDWIYDLNIGNVMFLSLMNAEELSDNAGSKSLENTTHELCKDSMLEKIVLVSVAYFCIATEMRFLIA